MIKSSRFLAALCLLPILGCSPGSPTDPAGFRVSPDVVSVPSGDSVQLTIVGSDGGTVNGDVVWRSSNPTAALIDGGGTVTGVYANGTTTVTAILGAARASATITTVPRFCFAIAPLKGTPDPAVLVQTFEVQFDPGTDAAAKAAELAARFDFVLLEVGPDSFTADLTPEQVGLVQCDGSVASVTYL